MTDTEKLNKLIDQVKKVRDLQKRFFEGEKTLLPIAKSEEAKLDYMCLEYASRTSQRHLF